MTTFGEVWQAFRGTENACRYCGDAMLGVIRMLGGALDQPVGSLSEEVEQAIHAMEDGVCIPPRCHMTGEEYKQEVRRLANRARALSSAVDLIVDSGLVKAVDIKFDATEQPGIHWATPGAGSGDKARAAASPRTGG